ncbi:MAG: ORF6N domain-containing protein [Bacilli bacterium]|nr:ORF6N domain-containing protein [Bacilli bacterium]
MSNVANEELVIVNENNIKEKIYLMRGQKVMLDFDLAEIYGFTTKRFNQQINRNIERFPDGFMFQITKEESNYLVRSQIVTTRIWTVGNSGSRTSMPYAFIELGILCL